MNISFKGNKDDHCMVFEGAMTRRCWRYIENHIIDSMRKHPRLSVDLSGVHELDLCGIRLLAALLGYGAGAIHVVAASPMVEAAISRLHPTQKGGERKSRAPGSVHAGSRHREP